MTALLDAVGLHRLFTFLLMSNHCPGGKLTYAIDRLLQAGQARVTALLKEKEGELHRVCTGTFPPMSRLNLLVG